MDSPKAPRTKILKQRPFCQAVFRGGRRITLHKVEVTYECLDTGTIFTHTIVANTTTKRRKKRR